MPSGWEWEYGLEGVTLVPKYRMLDKEPEGCRTTCIVETNIGHNDDIRLRCDCCLYTVFSSELDSEDSPKPFERVDQLHLI